MPTRSVPESQGRETRILLLIVAVSIALLLLLARLRYPAADLPVIAPTQAPLIELTSPRGFDDLNQRLASLITTVSPRVLTVDVESTPPPQARRRPGDVQMHLGTAVRVRPDLAVLHVPRGFKPRVVPGAGIDVLATDENRELAVLHVPPNLDAFSAQPPELFTGMTYVAVISATRAGPTLQPVYVGRVSPLDDQRWPGALDLGPLVTGVSGAALFSLEGRFLGIAVAGQGSTTLLSAQALRDVVGLLAPPGAPPQ